MAPRGFEQVERADCVHVEIIERNFCGEVVRRLCGGVDYDSRLESLNKFKHAIAVADVEFVMREICERFLHPLFVPACVALRPEKNFALVVVHAMHSETALVEVSTDFRADESG